MRDPKPDIWIATALFAGSLLILGPWTFADFSDQPWNNGYIYVAIARLFRDYKWTWNPLHYGGAPFHYLYPPVFHVLVDAIPFVSLPRAFHLLTAAGYALAPVCLYVLTRSLFRSRLLAVFAAVAYSVFPSPFYAFLPAWRHIAQPYAHAPWSFVDLVAYEEAAHISALPIMFLAVAAAWRGRWRLASCLAAVVFLTNWPALIGFGFAAAGIAVARRTAARVIGLIGVAYGLSAFWMTPGYFVSSSLLNRIVLRHTLTAAPWNGTTWLILAAAAGLIGLSLWRRVSPEFALIWTWFALSGAVVVCYTVLGNYLLPSPHRYILEFNAGCVLAVVSLIALLPSKLQLPVMAVLSVAGLGASLGFLSQPWTFERPSQDPRAGVAWQIADWLNKNTPNGSSRVLASGELDSTLALWSDLPQAGGSGQDVSNFLIWAAERQVAYGCGSDSAHVAELWLRALNVRWLVVHGAASREYFHWYAQPEKFAVLPVAWDNGAGDTIYQTPVLPEAVVVDLDAMRRLPPLQSTADPRFLEAYVNWAAGKRPASIHWNGVNSASIDAALAPGEAVLVRVNYAPGWRASGVSVASDPIGFLLLPGLNQGAAPRVDLRFGTSWDTWLGRAITALTIVLLLARVSGFRIACVAVIPALSAYLVLLAGVPPTAAVAEDAFVRLQPPLINPGGIVNAGGGVVSVYGLNFGSKTDSVRVWLGDREVGIVYHSPNLIDFRLPPDSPSNPPFSVEVNGCRGNEFTVAAR